MSNRRIASMPVSTALLSTLLNLPQQFQIVGVTYSFDREEIDLCIEDRCCDANGKNVNPFLSVVEEGNIIPIMVPLFTMDFLPNGTRSSINMKSCFMTNRTVHYQNTQEIETDFKERLIVDINKELQKRVTSENEKSEQRKRD